MNQDKIDTHLKEIIRYQKAIDQLGDDMLIQRIELLSKQLVFIGRLASTYSGYYKRVYAERKRAYAQAEIDSPPPRQAHAELAVTELREEESQAYEYYKRWNNAFDSTKEEINALKYKVRISMEDGSNNQGA